MPTAPTIVAGITPETVVPLLTPTLLLLGGALAGRARTGRAWTIGKSGSVSALIASASTVAWGSQVLPWESAMQGIQVLIAFLGWLLVRFASRYLDGEPNQPYFVRWLLTALGSAALVPASDNLLVTGIAWLGTGLALRQLLAFHPERRVAQEAADRKYLVTRVADALFLLGVGLLFARFGTLDRAAIAEIIRTAPPQGLAQEFAAVLIAAAAVLRTAQVPFQGWLIRVVDAPTPVSALLHAGIVNLGGVVLLAVHPLIADAPTARALLVVSGATTAIYAAWTGAERTSFKVGLAWSTSSQMGFMLIQCGLGLFEMAWLHLIAHSIYKAHAFLSAGTAVQTPADHRRPMQRSEALTGAALTVPALGLLIVTGMLDPRLDPALGTMAIVVALAVAPLVGQAARSGNLQAALTAVLVSASYALLHAVLIRWLGRSAVDPTTATLSIAISIAFVGLFAARFAVPARALGRIGRARLEI
jgi:NAD(P)H-quinone oxidoreductase subunit 5